MERLEMRCMIHMHSLWPRVRQRNVLSFFFISSFDFAVLAGMFATHHRGDLPSAPSRDMS